MENTMIVILGAMDSEIDGFLSQLEPIEQIRWKHFVFHRGLLAGQSVLIAKSGVGKVMSAMVTQHLIDTYRPRAVLFTGLAGSLRPDIDIGDVLLARDLVQHDLESVVLGVPRGQVPYSEYRFLASHPRLLELASTFVPATGQLHCGRICTGDQFITFREMGSHAYLTTELDGDGVEMEGASVALVCSVNEIPFLVARTISDKADTQAAINFEAFLPGACANSLALVRHLLPLIGDADFAATDRPPVPARLC